MRGEVKLAVAVLSVATGSLDVTAFLRLGGVFASVMTGNLVFVSVAAVNAEGSLARHCAVALIGYIVGVGVGAAASKPRELSSRPRTSRRNLLLGGELAVLVVYALLWMIFGADPTGDAQLLTLAAVAVAMGAQTAAARLLGVRDAGTTYLTGVLSGVVSNLAGGRRPDPGTVIALAGLLVGAATGAGLIQVIPTVVPLVAVAAVGLIFALSFHDERSKRAELPKRPVPRV